MVIGDSADPIIGGFDKLLSRDWIVESFKDRYQCTDSFKVLVNPIDLSDVFTCFTSDSDRIFDTEKFLNEVYIVESAGLYDNAFNTAGMEYIDAYSFLRMNEPLDMKRV